MLNRKIPTVRWRSIAQFILPQTGGKIGKSDRTWLNLKHRDFVLLIAGYRQVQTREMQANFWVVQEPNSKCQSRQRVTM
ncbi:MAG: hypothetical protein ABJM29_15695 [Rhizobiaceae bacterium]